MATNRRRAPFALATPLQHDFVEPLEMERALENRRVNINPSALLQHRDEAAEDTFPARLVDIIAVIVMVIVVVIWGPGQKDSLDSMADSYLFICVYCW